MIRLAFAAATLLIGSAVLQAQFDPEPKYDAATVDTLMDRVHADLNHHL